MVRCPLRQSPSARTSARNISNSFSPNCDGPALSTAHADQAADIAYPERADLISMAEVITAADEPLRVTRCDGDAVDGCVRGERCCAHDLWSSLGRQMMNFLSSDHP